MAKIVRIDHLGVAVRDVEKSINAYKNILGAELVADVEGSMMGSKMHAAYLKVGDNLIVMDGAEDPQGFLAKFIDKRGEGLHHVGLAVDNLDEFVKELEQKGVKIPHREVMSPLRKEIILSPKDLCGVVYQVIEWKEGDYPTVEERIERLKRAVK